MYLLINGQKEAKEIICLFNDQGLIDLVETDQSIGFSEQILVALDRLLNKNNLKLTDLKVIAVNNFNNTFSSLRSAVATANVIGYCTNLPVVAISQDQVSKLETKSLEHLRAKIRQNFEVLHPRYDHEPNITQAKKIN